jgi:hypothetical protein
VELTRQGRFALIVLAAFALVVLAIRLRESEEGEPKAPNTPREAGGATRSNDSGRSGHDPDATALRGHVDKIKRNEVRARIEALNASISSPDGAFDFAASRDRTPVGVATRTGPSLADTPLGHYIRARIRSDYMPLAKQCYEELLGRSPKAGGKIVATFRIVGDKRVGGVIESVDFDEGTTISDNAMLECLRESLLSVSFEPPPESAAVDVTYPIELAP